MTSLITDSLFFPVYAATFSATVLVIHSAFIYLNFDPYEDSGSNPPLRTESDAFLTGPESRSNYIARHGGLPIWAFKLARFVGSLALLSTSVAALHLLAPGTGSGGPGTVEVTFLNQAEPLLKITNLEEPTWQPPIFSLAMAYLYVSIISLLCLIAHPLNAPGEYSRQARIARTLPSHATFVLFVSFVVFALRDLYPLATFSKYPLDLPFKNKYGPLAAMLLWFHIAILAVTSLAIPLFTPRLLASRHSTDTTCAPSPAQTCSLASFLFYTFLDSTVLQARRVPHLAHDQLPPLAADDSAAALKEKTFPHLDPHNNSRKRRGRHVAFSLLVTFKVELAALAITLILSSAMNLAAPIGINRLLTYMETHGQGSVIRPWVWVAWLLLGPVTRSVANQLYQYLATGLTVRVEAVVTQLVFEHALRVRILADTASRSDGKRPDAHPEATTDIEHSAAGGGELDNPEAEPHANEDVSPRIWPIRSIKALIRSSFAQKSPRRKRKPPAKPPPTSGDIQGRITNLVTTDLTNITNARDFLLVVIQGPLLGGLCVWFLYILLGWSALVGIGLMLILFPLPGYLAQRLGRYQQEKMRATDARVQNVTETLHSLRMIKLFGWEWRANERIAEKRDDELIAHRKMRALDVASGIIGHNDGHICDLTGIMKQELSASIVFSSMTVFDILRDHVMALIGEINSCVQAKVSLDRLDDYLNNTTLLDEFAGRQLESQLESRYWGLSSSSPCTPPDRGNSPGFKDSVFSWSSTTSEASTPQSDFRLRIEGEVLFPHGQLSIVVGPTASGKSSLLLALLGEMHFIPSIPDSWYHLPRAGGVAYAAQESWVLNETIRANILFGSDLDEDRYRKVLYQCCLGPDLDLFDAGDLTEVGERGLTLSGGQKARVTLARAVYSRAEIVLLDDVFASLDVHTAKRVAERCLSGDLLRGRTVILAVC
ncbi:hypothetical protein HGRIS_007430 [Hohenbuehelia grisea]|uniref:ABC transporter n=1 Tax=Hohenbuehelia grisea TaxID=104357 RepID=A0ABR3J559_9AGAR